MLYYRIFQLRGFKLFGLNVTRGKISFVDFGLAECYSIVFFSFFFFWFFNVIADQLYLRTNIFQWKKRFFKLKRVRKQKIKKYDERSLKVEEERINKEGNKDVVYAKGLKYDIVKWFSKKRILNEITIGFQKNTITGIIGENGAGKSTLMNVLSGIFPRNSGDIKFGGKNIDWYLFGCADVGVCHQANFLLEKMTLKQNFEFFVKLRGLRAEVAHFWIEIIDLEDFEHYYP